MLISVQFTMREAHITKPSWDSLIPYVSKDEKGRESGRWSGNMHVSLGEREGTALTRCSVLLTHGNGQ